MANGILRCGEKGVCDIWEKWVSGWRNGHLMEAALDEPLHGVRREGEEGLDARGDRRALEEAEHRVATALLAVAGRDDEAAELRHLRDDAALAHAGLVQVRDAGRAVGALGPRRAGRGAAPRSAASRLRDDA